VALSCCCSPRVREIAAGSGIDFGSLLDEWQHARTDLSQITDHLRRAGSCNPDAQMIVRNAVLGPTITKRLLDSACAILNVSDRSRTRDARRSHVLEPATPPKGCAASRPRSAPITTRGSGYLTTYGPIAQASSYRFETPEAVRKIPALPLFPRGAIFIRTGAIVHRPWAIRQTRCLRCPRTRSAEAVTAFTPRAARRVLGLREPISERGRTFDNEYRFRRHRVRDGLGCSTRQMGMRWSRPCGRPAHLENNEKPGQGFDH